MGFSPIFIRTERSLNTPSNCMSVEDVCVFRTHQKIDSYLAVATGQDSDASEDTDISAKDSDHWQTGLESIGNYPLSGCVARLQRPRAQYAKLINEKRGVFLTKSYVRLAPYFWSRSWFDGGQVESVPTSAFAQPDLTQYLRDRIQWRTGDIDIDHRTLCVWGKAHLPGPTTLLDRRFLSVRRANAWVSRGVQTHDLHHHDANNMERLRASGRTNTVDNKKDHLKACRQPMHNRAKKRNVAEFKMESTFVVTASTAMPYQCTSELWFELEIYELVKARPPTSRDNQTTMYDLAVELRLQFVATKEGKAKMPTTAGDPASYAGLNVQQKRVRLDTGNLNWNAMATNSAVVAS
ncbi:hypothetical protein BDV98DRAFT_585130 [Pterulicium gracile]|uniref:Uncharacterized protein n=1 Tax=Pterulicium gracile TaxID=1884261 RepID=A0A5C3QCU8_9AGAR|nr:hypothetical protein BDV98DRAFT_585130 [Pterula gracilis]